MSRINVHNYDSTFTENLAFFLNELKGKNIIYSVQYIINEDTEIDRDGPESWWCVEFLSIEKTDEDYIFHTFTSNTLHSYSFPYFVLIKKAKYRSVTLSYLKNQITNLFDKPLDEISSFISIWKQSYSHASKSTDETLLKELITISSTISELKVIQKKKVEKIQQDYQKYIESSEYKKIQKEFQKYQQESRKKEEKLYEKKEEERLVLCVEQFGEIEGRRFWKRL